MRQLHSDKLFTGTSLADFVNLVVYCRKVRALCKLVLSIWIDNVGVSFGCNNVSLVNLKCARTDTLRSSIA